MSVSDDLNIARLLDKIDFVVLRLDPQWIIQSINRNGLKLLGYERPEEIAGQHLKSLIPTDQWDGAHMDSFAAGLEKSERTPHLEFDLLNINGERIPMIWGIEYSALPGGLDAPILLVGFDATEIRQNQEAADLFKTVAENYSGAIIITDRKTRIRYANPAASRISGYSSEELLGHTPALFRSGETHKDVYRDIWETINNHETWRGEIINRRKDGTAYLESKSIAAIRDKSDEVQYYFTIGEDITQRQQYQHEIERLTLFDQLTGLPNRTAFLRELGVAMESASLAGQELALLHVDFDDFKKANFAYGPNVADQVLVEAAARIKETVRQSVLLARIAGDEFALLLGPSKTSIAGDSKEIALRVLSALHKPFAHQDQTINVTASIGIVCYPGGGDSAQELLGNAMSATLNAKSSGGNKISHFETAMAAAEGWRRELLQAVERDEMILYYQPQVSLFSGGIIGLEALIRWQHPVRGMVPPNDFIPLAEESNHIVVIGEWVLAEACRQMRAWRDAGLPPIKLAINLAARHFRLPSLPSSIAQVLAVHRIEARFLEIEITESAMMLDMTAAVRNMGQLKELGVRISLDDFGTGYSSMAYLSRFPIDVVKIDQSFVHDITTNPGNAAIAQATIAMSHKLGKTVLAEGVETAEQMHYLRRNNCDEMQGYYFSRPLPAEEITRMLQQNLQMGVLPQAEWGEGSTILIVDDEANILSSLKRVLRREGYNILFAQNTEEAFSLLAKNQVHVVVSDQRIPGMSGTEFLSQVKIIYPETVRMVLSAYSEIATVTDAINKGAAYRFLTKPWDDEQLKEEIRGALRHWRELYAMESKR